MGKKGIVDVSASDISEPLPASQAGGVTSARIFPGNGDSAVAETLELGSTFALLRRSARDFPDRSCFGWREQPGEGSFKFLTYADVLSKVTKLATALISHFSLPVGTKVGIYGKNCPAWSMTQYAVNAAGMVIVPIYDTLGVDIVEYVCNHSEAKIVFIASENYEKWKAAQPRCSTVEHVVLFDVGPLEDSAEVKKIKKDDNVLSFWDVLDKGTDIMDSLPSPNVDDLNVIMYTSGTTGKPKGVMLLNRNLLASVGSAYFFFSKWDQDFVETDVYLSYLPLSHIFEQQAQALFIGKGAKIGFYSGNIKLLLSDMEELCPTVFAGVPRVFARFQQRIEENVEKSSFIKRLLFKWAYDRQLEAVQNPTQVSRSPLWDSLVMNKVREKLLPKCRLVITGSAPMSAQTNDFLKICLNCPVVQGYGLTETVGGMNCSAPGVSTSGTCGGPLPGSIVKLADLPEMGYLSSNKPHPQGEVCVKGDVVFSGYFKNQEATDAAFDADGYFHTGDVGRWNLDGTLQIIDRAKNLFKLSQGEYVSPESLEQEYAKAKLVLQIFVYGNSLQSTLLAVVVPDSDAAKVWGKENINSDDVLQIASSPEFKKEVLAQLLEMHGKAKFKSYEKIVDIVIEANDLNELGQGFTVDNNLMTPSFKLKRPQLNQKYKARLDEIYNAKK